MDTWDIYYRGMPRHAIKFQYEYGRYTGLLADADIELLVHAVKYYGRSIATIWKDPRNDDIRNMVDNIFKDLYVMDFIQFLTDCNHTSTNAHQRYVMLTQFGTTKERSVIEKSNKERLDKYKKEKKDKLEKEKKDKLDQSKSKRLICKRHSSYTRKSGHAEILLASPLLDQVPCSVLDTCREPDVGVISNIIGTVFRAKTRICRYFK